MLVPTAAQADLSGRAANADGRGISRARITLTDGQTGATRTVLTNNFGYFSFRAVKSGVTYIIKAEAKNYTFGNPQVINVNDSLGEINFNADR